MLSFATEFPVNGIETTSEFLREVQEWILASPFTIFTRSDIEGMNTERPWELEKESSKIQVLNLTSESGASSAIKYISDDSDLTWETNIVFSKQLSDTWIGVRVSCESNHPSTNLPSGRKPIIVKNLVDKFGGAADGCLVVANTPHRLTSQDIDLAAGLMTGDSKCRLPIVYISFGDKGESTIDANKLAYDLGGMAHVLVEPNRPFSLRLKVSAKSQNVYGGTVGVYWPDGGGRRALFIGRQYEDGHDIARGVIDEIKTALTNRRTMDRCSWASLKEAVSRQDISNLQKAGSREVDEYIRIFEQDIEAKEDRIREAESEISRLKAEVRKFEFSHRSASGLNIQLGTEENYFENEIEDVLLDSLSSSLDKIPTESRRQQLVQSILNANPLRGKSKELKEELKETLRNYQSLDAPTRRKLEEMGFSIQSDGKHHKLTYHNDTRYVFSLSKTSSDHRGGLNISSDISKTLF